MRSIYIDLGANVGNTVREFLKGHPGYSCYAFEPNRALLPRIADVALELGRDINLVWAAAWIHDGRIDLFQSDSPSASTVVEGKKEYEERGWPAIDYSRPSASPSIDFSQWLLRNFSKDDHIVVKMDIEGAEYKVLGRMLEEGTVGLIAKLRCEWHYDRFPDMPKAEHDRIKSEVARYTILEDWE